MAAVTGAVIAVGSAAYSIAQSEKQKSLSKQAEADADKAFTAAQKELDVNYFEELGISKTPYENQREALLVSAAQAMQQGQLSERGATATAGQVLAQANTSQQNVTDAQIQQTEALEKLIAEEDKSLAAKRAELQLAQAEGAGIASAQAQNASNASIQQGVTALANLGMSAFENSELYSQNNTGLKEQRTSVGNMNFTPEELAQFGNVQGYQAVGTDGFSNLDFNAIGEMSRGDFRRFRRDLTPEQQKMLELNPFKTY